MLRLAESMRFNDEPLALDLLADYCAQVPFLTVRGQFHEALAGLAFLRDTPVDVVFPDIPMPRLSGVQLSHDLRHVEGRKEYLLLHTGADKLLTLQLFQQVLEALPAGWFVRIHKSFVVALRHIEHVERGRVQVAGQLLPIGDSYREAFLACLHAHQQLGATWMRPDWNRVGCAADSAHG